MPTNTINDTGLKYVYDKLDNKKIDKADLTKTHVTGNPISIITESAQMASGTIIRLNPIETGSGTKSPDNPWTISGRDKIEVLSSGKNLVKKINQGSRQQGSGVIDQTVTTRVTADYIDTKQVAYTVSATSLISGKTVQCAYQEYTPNGNGTYSRTYDSGWNNLPVTFTPSSPNTGRLTSLTFRFTDDSSITPSNITAQLEEGATATTYENPNIATNIQLSLGQTVYGGYLDLEKGVLLGTLSAKKKLSDLTWNYQSANNRFFTTAISDIDRSGLYTPDKLLCSHMETNTNGISSSGDGISCYTNGQLYLRVTGISTVEALLSTMGDADIVYQLATPIEIQLTPHEISLLSGYNYISTNCNEIDTYYKEHGEVASMEDVGNLASVVNELGDRVDYVANNVGDYVDLTSTAYQFPSDGYVVVDSQAVTTGVVRVQIIGNNNVAIGGIYMNITSNYQIQATFVRKGMSARVIYDTANTRKRFYPLY